MNCKKPQAILIHIRKILNCRAKLIRKPANIAHHISMYCGNDLVIYCGCYKCLFVSYDIDDCIIRIE